MLVQMSREMLLADPAVQSNPRLASDLGDIHVESLATSLARYDYRVPRHSHADIFQFFIIESGRVDCHLANQFVTVNGPGVLVVPTNTTHQMSFSDETIGYLISISHGLLSAFECISGSGDWLTVLNQPSWNTLDAQHEAVVGGKTLWALYIDAIDHRLQLTANTLSFVSSIVTVCADSSAKPKLVVSQAQQRLVDAFLDDIENNYASSDTVANYCDRMNVTERTLRRATTACLNLSPIALIHKRKCLEAQRLLRFTPLSIAAIAHTLGFSDPSYFSRRFKQLTGKVPREIRP